MKTSFREEDVLNRACVCVSEYSQHIRNKDWSSRVFTFSATLFFVSTTYSTLFDDLHLPCGQVVMWRLHSHNLDWPVNVICMSLSFISTTLSGVVLIVCSLGSVWGMTGWWCYPTKVSSAKQYTEIAWAMTSTIKTSHLSTLLSLCFIVLFLTTLQLSSPSAFGPVLLPFLSISIIALIYLTLCLFNFSQKRTFMMQTNVMVHWLGALCSRDLADAS